MECSVAKQRRRGRSIGRPSLTHDRSDAVNETEGNVRDCGPATCWQSGDGTRNQQRRMNGQRHSPVAQSKDVPKGADARAAGMAAAGPVSSPIRRRSEIDRAALPRAVDRCLEGDTASQAFGREPPSSIRPTRHRDGLATWTGARGHIHVAARRCPARFRVAVQPRSGTLPPPTGGGGGVRGRFARWDGLASGQHRRQASAH
jgi:hypothetical protein